ncbi:DUF2817 domain-containing protein [Hyphomonas sp. NPDC076900]|uniref:DUF2817 domain-containing protein n=1 Tax=unclassified Hyphomonas TaxID=2630699 RepID=UPI003D06A546
MHEPPAHPHFPDSYAEGRSRFLRACRLADAEIQSHTHPSLYGPAGEALAIDSAWVGRPDARNILFVSCGTHGLEAAAGAATIVQWLETQGPASLSRSTAILFVHAVNPYGWAYARRGNEDGIDLNRNFIDHSASLPHNAAYSELHSLIMKTSAAQLSLAEFSEDFQEFCANRSNSYALNGITSGQYQHQNGLSFGGLAPSWSRQILERIVRTYLVSTQKILHIDWHTGIGPFSQPFFILDDTPSSEAYRLASSWWPSHTIHCDDVVAGTSIKYHGLLSEGLKTELARHSPAHMISLTVEWGTYEVDRMLEALVIDNWLAHRSSGSGPEFVHDAQERLKQLFCPSDTVWRQSVLLKSQDIYRDALAALEAW